LEEKMTRELYRKGIADHWSYSLDKRKDWQIILDWIRRNCRKGTILDIGCFDGGFLESLAKGWQRYGIETNEEAAEKARRKGIQIIAEDLGKIGSLPMKFDITVAIDVVEHVEDPFSLLKSMSEITRPGGVIIISSGNSMALPWRFMGSKYWYCSYPEHISFINERWCLNAAEKLGLVLHKIQKFSRKSGFIAKGMDLIANVIYKTSPAIIGMLRMKGIGNIDIKKHEEMKTFPPTWLTAKDHMVVIFGKKM